MFYSNGDRIDRLETLAETALLAIQQLAAQQRQAQTDLAASINDGVSMIATNSRHIGEMQQHMKHMQAEVRGLQVENRHILEELADIRRQRARLN